MAEKDSSGFEIFESGESLQKEFNKAESFITKNKNLLTYAGAAVIAVALGVFAYNYWSSTQDEEAQAALFVPFGNFEADSLNKALNGTAAAPGLVTIAKEYGSTDAGNIANFIAGAAFMKQGKFDNAIEHLEKFSSSDLLLQARAYSLIGDAYLEKKNPAEAIKFYEKAADYKPNKSYSPVYLNKLAIAQEAAKDNAGALETLTKLIETYPTSQEAIMAKRFKSKLEATLGQ
jgi:TolA-binding protein